MAYLLDTDVVDHLGNDPAAVRLVEELSARGLAMSAVSYMEAYQGIGRGANPARTAASLADLVTIVPVLPFHMEEARQCAEIREALRLGGRRVNPRALDLMIAATAIEHDLTLVTRNSRDYRDVPGLTLYRSG